MPIYQYKCCCSERELELIQKYEDSAPICEKCGKLMIKQVSKNTSFILHGSGWYATDYKSK